jgi:hypothetical protein
MAAHIRASLPFNQIQSGRDIDPVLNGNRQIKNAVQSHFPEFHVINIANAMRSLEQVSNLLQIAYIGSRGHPCSVGVLDVITSYQSLIKDCYVTTEDFVNQSISAMQCIQTAEELKGEGHISIALEMIAETGNMAGAMAEEAQTLVADCQVLCIKSKEVLLEAARGEVIYTEILEKTQDTERSLRADQASLERVVQDLSANLIREQGRERKDAKTMRGLNRKAFALASFSALMIPLDSGIHSPERIFERQIIACTSRQAETIQNERGLQQALRKANSDLSRSIVQLSTSVREGNNIKKAIDSLNVTVQTLTKVRTIFENTRIFWVSVKKHCNGLSRDISRYERVMGVSTSQFDQKIHQLGIRWLTIAKMNYEAACSMGNVNTSIDSIVSNLPSSAESAIRFRENTEKMLDALEQENRALELA